MNKGYKVSVILPIYNVEDYLKRSIESIQKQDLGNIQIILVNDGSTDNSLSICMEYAKIDNRIYVVDKPNGGVSSARNAGLEVALGEYIGFVDPDDWVEPNMYSTMYNQAKRSKTEICMCNYFEDCVKSRNPVSLNIDKELLERIDVIEELVAYMISPSTLDSNENSIIGSVCRMIISNDFIKRYNLKFNEQIYLMEDLLFCIEALLKNNKVSIIKEYFYHYCHNSSSAVNLYRKYFWDINYKVFNMLIEITNKEMINPIMFHHMNIRYVNMCLNSIVNELRTQNKKPIKEKIEMICKICKDQKLKVVLNNIDTKRYTLRKRFVLYSLRNEKVFNLISYYLIINKVVKR